MFTYIKRPSYQLSAPDKVMSEGEFELLSLTVADYRYVTSGPTEELSELAAELRARSTILRRLLCHGDLFNAGKLLRPKRPLTVRAQMLEFDPIHPGVMISCGGYPWQGDILPGMAAVFSVRGVPSMGAPGWRYRNEEVSLSAYLDGLAVCIMGTPVRRRELIKYVADKKAAHVSDQRKHEVEEALDRVWSQLAITIVASTGESVRLGVGYLELLPVIDALATSASVREYIDELDAWLCTARIRFEGAEKRVLFHHQIEPKQRLST